MPRMEANSVLAASGRILFNETANNVSSACWIETSDKRKKNWKRPYQKQREIAWKILIVDSVTTESTREMKESE